MTKGEYMKSRGIKSISHIDPEEKADKKFKTFIDMIAAQIGTLPEGEENGKSK